MASAHLNQKPLEFMRRIISAVTAPGDVVWEPFGGLCSAIAAAIELDRRGFASEPYDDFYELASERLEDIERQQRGVGRSKDLKFVAFEFTQRNLVNRLRFPTGPVPVLVGRCDSCLSQILNVVALQRLHDLP